MKTSSRTPVETNSNNVIEP